MRAKDSFVVVHPSESVGIICSICNKTFTTKKSLKRHCKYIHKSSARSKSIARNQDKIAAANGSGAKDGPHIENSVGYSNSRSQSHVPAEKECKKSEPLKLSEQKMALNTLSKSIKAKTSKNEPKPVSKKKPVKVDIMKSGVGMKRGKISLKNSKENERVKSLSKVNKTIMEKSKNVLAGKKVALVNSKSSSSNVKFTRKPLKTEKVVKLDKTKSADLKTQKIESKTGRIISTSKKANEPKKVTLKDRSQQELTEIRKKEKAAMIVDTKAAIIVDKKNEKNVNKAQGKQQPKLPLIKKELEIVMPFKCDECGEGFRNMFNLRKHLPIHSIIKYHCYRCEDVFMNMRSLTKHLLIHEDEAPVVDHLHRCRICSQGFKTSRMLRGHLLEHERVEGLESSVSSSSKYKSKSFDSKHTAIKVNQKSEHSHSLYVPNEDSKRETITKESLSASQNMDKDFVLKNSEKVLEKDLSASKEFNGKEQDSLLCTSCQLSFQGYTQFRHHVIESHINFGDMSLQCDKCSEVFTSEAEVISHLVKEHELTYREARVVVRQKEREAVLCGSRAKVSAASQHVSCDSSGCVNVHDDFNDPKVRLVRSDSPFHDDCSPSLCKEESTGFEGRLLADERQQSVEIEKTKSVGDCYGSDGDLPLVNKEDIETRDDSLCFMDAHDLNTEKEGRDFIGHQKIDTDIKGVDENLVSNEIDRIKTGGDSCIDLKDPATEKSCFLEEQESRDILQALFIEVEEENPSVLGQDIAEDSGVFPVQNCDDSFNRSECKTEQTRVNDAKVGANASKQCTGKGKETIDSSVVEANVFAPFIRRKASICGERRILEAISAGRKKVDNLPKKRIYSGNELGCDYDLHNGPEIDNALSVNSKEQRETLQLVGGGRFAENPMRGRKRKPLLNSKHCCPNEQQTWNGTLGQANNFKKVRHSKRRKRCWMFGKIHRHAKRNQAKKSGEKTVLKQISDVSPVLWDECQNICQSPKPNTDKKLIDPCITPEEVVVSNCTASEVKDCPLNGRFVESDCSEKQECTTQGECCTADGSREVQSKESESKSCNIKLNGCREETLKEPFQSDTTRQVSGSDKADIPNCSTEWTETSSLASLIYIPRRAAVAGQGKMQRASKSRNISCPSDAGIDKPVSRKRDVSVVFSNSSSLAKEGRNSQKRRGKSHFTNVKKRRKSKAGSNLNNLCLDDELSGGEKFDAYTSCSSFSCLNAESGGQRSETSLILSNKKNKPVKWNESSDINKKLTCNSCGKRFNTMYFLRLHEKRHGGDEQESKKVHASSGKRAAVFRCKSCNLDLSSKVALANHLKVCHGHRKHQRASSTNVNGKRYKVQLPKSKQKQASK